MKKILFILTLFILAIPVYSTSYYLRADGNDTCTGLSIDKAVKTFGRASELMSAGDYLFCDGNGGIYDLDTIQAVFTVTGTSDSIVYIIGFNDFKMVNSNEDTVTYFSLVAADYVEVNRIIFNDEDDYDSVMVYLGYENTYWIKNCNFYEGAFIQDSLGTAKKYPAVYLRNCMFCQGDSTYKSIIVQNDMDETALLDIDYCSFYLTTPVYIENTDGDAAGLVFTNSIIEKAKYIWEVGSGELTVTTQKNFVYYNAGSCNSEPVVTLDTTSYNANPLYNNPTKFNFYLQYDSPCIQFSTNAGTIGAKTGVSMKAGGE